MDFYENDQAEAIATEWGVSRNLLDDTSWVLEEFEGNDGEIYGYLVRFDDGTDQIKLKKLGLSVGELTREVSLNAFDPDVPSDESDDDTESFDRVTATDQMKRWFHKNYEDPANSLPYETKEGGYQWIYGGATTPLEALEDMFSNRFPFEFIEEVATSITDEAGIWDWTPKPSHEFYGEEENPSSEKECKGGLDPTFQSSL